MSGLCSGFNRCYRFISRGLLMSSVGDGWVIAVGKTNVLQLHMHEH